MQMLLWCCSVMQQDGFSWWLKAILKLLVLLYMQKKTPKPKTKASQMWPKKAMGKKKVSEEHLQYKHRRELREYISNIFLALRRIFRIKRLPLLFLFFFYLGRYNFMKICSANKWRCTIISNSLITFSSQ